MNLLIRGIMILPILIMAAACSVKSEDRVCTYNNVVVSCDGFDQQRDGTTSHENTPQNAPPRRSAPANPSQVAPCVTYAIRAPISQVDAERLCSESPALGQCVADTIRGSISQVDAERLCRQ